MYSKDTKYGVYLCAIRGLGSTTAFGIWIILRYPLVGRAEHFTTGVDSCLCSGWIAYPRLTLPTGRDESFVDFQIVSLLTLAILQF
jgi:hypothetical protein